MRLLPSRMISSLVLALLAPPAALARELTVEQRVDAQRAIERVYWSHRHWSATNPAPKPEFAAAMPDSALRAKVEDYLRRSRATPAQLQQEIDRMAARTRAPEVLRELFDALGNDPYLVAETLARQTLVERATPTVGTAAERAPRYRLPTFAAAGCRRARMVESYSSGGGCGEHRLRPSRRPAML